MHIENNSYYANREQYITLVNAIEENADTDAILQLSNVAEYYTFVPPIFAGLCARNGIECFSRISAYKKLIGPFIL